MSRKSGGHFPVVKPPRNAKDDSLDWIKSYADGLGLHWRTLLEGADEWVRSKERGRWGEYLVQGGLLEGERTSDEFWVHYEILRDKDVPEDAKTNFFSCSC